MPTESWSVPAPVVQPVTFDCGDVVLRGDQWAGADPERNVLFLHGGGQTRHSWGRAAEQLARLGWTTTAVDLRGHGDSDWSPDGRYGVAANAEDIRQVVARLGPGLVLVGASLGGLTALTVQGVNPEAARGLVLVDIVPRASAGGVQRIRAFMTDHLGGFGSLDEVAEAIATYTRRERKRDLSGLKKNVRRREDGRWYWHWDPKMITSQRDIDTEPPVNAEDLLDVARRVTVPVLIVRGGQSDVVTQEGVQELQQNLTNSSVVVVAGAGHMVAGDDNDVFIKAVEDFLAGLD
jgi:pimeloyl-ACP methyl ester carboxylesterase